MTFKYPVFAFLVFAFFSCQSPSKTYLFVGSYTDGQKAEGIYVYKLKNKTGALIEVEREGNLINPSFLTISPNGKFLYACTESKMATSGSVSAFAIDSLTGKITFLNKQSAGGRNPVHVVVDQHNEYVICSNFTDAGISVFKCDTSGRLEPLSELLEFSGKSIVSGRQDEAHLHSAHFSPDNNYVFAPDLGTDKIRAFTFDHQNLLTEIDSLTVETKKGSGPRHFTFHPNHKWAYCIEEISGAVSFYAYQNGHLELRDSYFSYSKKQESYSSADIHVSPDGKFLYASNRGAENTIAIFAINEAQGSLSLIGHQPTGGEIPRSFVIDPSGQFLMVANRSSNQISVFKRDLKSGLLTITKTVLHISDPSSLKMRKYGN